MRSIYYFCMKRFFTILFFLSVSLWAIAGVLPPEVEQKIRSLEFDIEADALPHGVLLKDSALTIGTDGTLIYRDIYTVDSLTDNINISINEMTPTGWQETSRMLYRRNSAGDPLRYGYFSRGEDGKWVESAKLEYTYDFQGRRFQQFYSLRDTANEWAQVARATVDYEVGTNRPIQWVMDVERDGLWAPFARYKYGYAGHHRNASFCYHLPVGAEKWKLTSEYELYTDTTVRMISQIYCDYSGVKAHCPSRCDMYYDKNGNMQVQLFFYSDKNGAWVHNATTFNYYHMDDTDTIWNTVQSGAFSVSDTRAVRFSPGNLQYQPSTHTFRFAELQSDVIGDDNQRIQTAHATRAWIDLFGWATALHPSEHSDDISEYSDFIDWGIHTIGDFVPNTWRTMTADEWDYLFHGRYRAEELYAAGRVNNAYGIIILPDNFELPKNFAFKPGVEGWEDNKYNMKQWLVLEQMGAIFLPVGGHRNGISIYHAFENGFYWSTTPSQSRTAFALGVNQEFLDPRIDEPRSYGLLVRLVRDTEKPEIIYILTEEELKAQQKQKKQQIKYKLKTEETETEE